MPAHFCFSVQGWPVSQGSVEEYEGHSGYIRLKVCCIEAHPFGTWIRVPLKDSQGHSRQAVFVGLILVDFFSIFS